MVDRGGTTQRLASVLVGAALVLTVSGCTGASPSVSPSGAPSESAGPNATMQASAAPEPAWTATGSLLEARWVHTATLLPDGRVLVAGGNIFPGGDVLPSADEYLPSAELYDPDSGSWTATGAMTEARGGGQSATLLQDGRVLVAGGTSTSAPFMLASAELYDPAPGTWTATGSMTAVRSAQTATLLPDGRVLVAGGRGEAFGPVATAELYDPETETWSVTGSMTTARFIHTATLLDDGKVLVTGGQGNDGSSPIRGPSDALVSAELYDPETGTWAATGSMTDGRQGQTATLLPDGTVLVAGGFGLSTDVQPTNFAAAELYNPATHTWAAADAMINARSGHTATLLSGGRVLVAGGGDLSGVLAEAELFDSHTGSWSAAGTLIEPRISHTATLLSDGRVLVAGGGDVFPTALAELFAPDQE